MTNHARFQPRRICRGQLLLGAGLALGLLTAAQTQAATPPVPPTFSVLYNFLGGPDDGTSPSAVTPAGDGGYYGTTTYGGTDNFGTVYELAADGTETVLYNFTGGADGGLPYDGVIQDPQGNLYGTTQQGGNSGCFAGSGCGVVFKLAPDGQETVLYAFPDSGVTGQFPGGRLLLDADGNLYGAAALGGDLSCNSGLGCGVLFKLAPDGTYTILHSFTAGADGAFPNGYLIQDSEGNLYGMTRGEARQGQPCSANPEGCGSIFRVAPDGAFTALFTFPGNGAGSNPTGGLVSDTDGNLYGTAQRGGYEPCSGPNSSCGVVFELSLDATYSVLYSFKGPLDGFTPSSSLYRNPRTGALYGTTSCLQNGCGTVFLLKPDGSKQTVYRFYGSNFSPIGSGLVKGEGFQLVGASGGGTHNAGAIYSLRVEH